MDDHASARADSKDSSEAEYELMLTLEDLESVLEELEETAEASGQESTSLSDVTRELLAPLGIRDAGQLRARIAELHEELDRGARF